MITLDRLRSGDVAVTVSVSGGKDSAATALHLRELGIPFRAVFADTGWEADCTYDYIDQVLQPAIGPIEVVRATIAVLVDRMPLVEEVEAILGRESPMVRRILAHATFPSRTMRWCTGDLKAAPLRAWHQQLLAGGRTVAIAVGVRADESKARAGLPEWEIGEDLDALVRRPILTWGLDQVIAIHHRHGLAPNPLYLRGAGRVGCFPCIQARKEE